MLSRMILSFIKLLPSPPKSRAKREGNPGHPLPFECSWLSTQALGDSAYPEGLGKFFPEQRNLTCFFLA